MCILILGASGYTGMFLKKYLSDKADCVYGTYRTEKEEYQKDPFMFHFAVEQQEELQGILKKTNPDVVVSCLRGDFAKQLEAHKTVIRYLQQKGHGKLIFLSTSNVFDKDLTRMHVESDVPNAGSDYGKYKAECENMILRELGKNAIVLRTSFILGKKCRRSELLLRCIKTGEKFVTYENIEFNYTTVMQVAEWLWYILKHDFSGVFHVGTKDTCGYTEFVQRLVKGLGLAEPEYDVEYYQEKSYLAVIPSREEIPDEMQIRIDDVEKELCRVIGKK